jgi:hypothetical protein
VEDLAEGVAGANRGRTNEAMAGRAEPPQLRSAEGGSTQTTQVSAVFRKGSNSPETGVGGHTPNPDAAVAEQRVAPTGAPTVHAGGGNSCTPGNEALDWTVVDAGANWRADVTALRVSGDIHITDWPNNPTSMTTPNTANPVDGGNINNTAGSANHWQAAIDDMADYDTAAGGGAGPNWHSTAASRAHEWAHWNEDYLADCIPAGNWVQTNQDIDQMTVPKGDHADAASARAALAPRVTARFNLFVAAVTRRWNAVIASDVPGGGGRGYAAGTRVLSGLIGGVRTYATGKGWARRPAHEAPAPGGGTPAPDAGGSTGPGRGTGE